tara:strand:- start:755 stop:1915 length:1161 start_codon:yes stop_codon:yes gene_type:complete
MKLRSVYLENFRSYKKLNIKIKNIKFVILTGKNGTGKTNLLEAISFLSPGKGFKNCRLDEVINTNSNSNHSSIFFTIEDKNEKNEIGIGFFNESKDDKFQARKIIHLNGKKLTKQSNLPNLVSLIWLIPEMDIFFRTNSLFRRKFIDRCIFNLNPDYLDYLRIYEKNLKERNKILKDLCANDFFYIKGKNLEKDLWLEKIEERLVNEGIKIFLERIKFSNDFNSLSNNFKSFPRIKIFLKGKIEKLFSSENLETIKKIYLQKLLNCRKVDSIKGSISYGPNKSDLKVIFLKKKKLAEKCSTGEQKIILISLIIKFCKLMNNKKNYPLLLLDEVVAHLDNKVKLCLFEELKTLKNQVWMSGSDISLFSYIIKDKEVVNLEIEDLLKQ